MELIFNSGIGNFESVQSLRYANRDLVGFFMQVDGGGMDQIWILVGIFHDFFCAEYIIAMYGDLKIRQFIRRFAFKRKIKFSDILFIETECDAAFLCAADNAVPIRFTSFV